MLIELNGFPGLLLWISKEIGMNILSSRCFKNGFGAQALVNMQLHRVNLRGAIFTLASPFQPGLFCYYGL